MLVSYKEARFQYTCLRSRSDYAKASCQYVSGMAVDEIVVEEFFDAIKPAHIDALQKVAAKEAKRHQETLKHLDQEVARLEFEAKRAERQYDNVDPENRLIAATLEKKWESAMGEFQRAQAKRDQVKQADRAAQPLSPRLREAFADVGNQLPDLWPKLAVEAKKALLRVLIQNVNLLRQPDGMLQIRVAWIGGLVTERSIRTRVHTLRHSATEKRIVERVQVLTDEWMTAEQIAERLNTEGFIPCRGETFTKAIVTKLKVRHRILDNRKKASRGEVTSAYTVPEIAKLVKIDTSWIYRHISAGVIDIEKDARYHCYLFPRNRQTVALLNRLKRKEVSHVKIPKVH